MRMESLRKLLLVLLILGCRGTLGGAEYLKYQDPKQPLNARINDLLKRMTLAEKIGQMSQIERENATATDVLKTYFIGINASFSSKSEYDNRKLFMELNILVQNLVTDIESALTRDPALVKKIGAATALEVRATGIPYVFAPCVAVISLLQVCRDPRWGRCYESYSEDPNLVKEMTEIIPGLQGDIPANSRKGVPFVAGKYGTLL
ncbi:hypothetical protein B296_00040852 [Ensete ventricosum]|uniref:Glycoside hydrolase family 3 N-terminal domain-containing protein n=1 Tax=Ensete ventricosum TaxID=4639 RepID=A0A426ZP47_ENSVE|nr:hypothetical protein B296_00040852 [Ensete ventricosum]